VDHDNTGEAPKTCDRHRSKFTVRLPEELRQVVQKLKRKTRCATNTQAVIAAVNERARRMGLIPRDGNGQS
jgi:hypothetical protein